MTITVSRAQRWKVRARHLLTGAGVIVLTGGALALPAGLTPPEPQYLDVDVVDVGAGDTTLVCPGAPQLAIADEAAEVSYDDDLGTGADTLSARATLAAIAPLDDRPSAGEVDAPMEGVELFEEVEAGPTPLVAQYPPVGGSAPSVAGVTIGHASEGDLRGMVGGGCISPSSSMWLVGGNTEIGSSTQLVLTNPGETAARVRVKVWTGVGPATGEIVELLEPGTSKAVRTETLERTDRLAFHVASEGGKVAAYLNTSRLEGIVPSGVSYVTPGAPPALETYVGPVRLEEFEAAEWLTELRMVNPEEDAARVSIQLLGPEGEEALGGAQEITIEPGVVTEVPVAAPEPGEYALQISSDVPVAASINTHAKGEYSEAIGGTPSDASWLASGQPAPQAMLVNTGEPTLALTNPSTEPAELVVEGVTDAGELGARQQLTVGPRQTVGIDPPKGAVAIRITGATVLASAQYQLEENGPLVAAVPSTWGGPGGASIAVVADN